MALTLSSPSSNFHLFFPGYWAFNQVCVCVGGGLIKTRGSLLNPGISPPWTESSASHLALTSKTRLVHWAPAMWTRSVRGGSGMDRFDQVQVTVWVFGFACMGINPYSKTLWNEMSTEPLQLERIKHEMNRAQEWGSRGEKWRGETRRGAGRTQEAQRGQSRLRW